ncbi:MAG: alpha/beta hydrolase [Ruminococcaceae bacterium]|nr:alpha/beta hydrolase [Oscillospiraceae bacterium]
MKYPINREFFPFSRIAPPIRNPKVAGWMGSKMKPPRRVLKNRDKDVSVTKRYIKGYGGADIQIFIFEPFSIKNNSPCLVYYHGGGFFFEGAGYHYSLAKKYAIEVGCRVVFVCYRLAPKYPHPVPAEDCYSALEYIFGNADALKVDKSAIAVGGDSAGGALAAAVCQMARDRGSEIPLFQLLIYPVTDRRMDYDSCRKYTDTPMWNAKLSGMMWQGYVPNPDTDDIAYASPMEADRFDGLPDAYIETAEFDCLHDEAIAYASALSKSGSAVTLNETKGTMHGFDIVKAAPTTINAVNARINYMKNRFWKIQ